MKPMSYDSLFYNFSKTHHESKSRTEALADFHKIRSKIFDRPFSSTI